MEMHVILSNRIKMMQIFFIQFQFNFLKDPLTLSNAMMNTIGLQGIARKIDSYTNCDAFLTDIDALVHIYSVAFDSKL